MKNSDSSTYARTPGEHSISESQAALMSQRNALLDEQETLRVHYYRTNVTELSADDEKFVSLELQIREINKKLSDCWLF